MNDSEIEVDEELKDICEPELYEKVSPRGILEDHRARIEAYRND
jgi:hypothetical protein